MKYYLKKHPKKKPVVEIESTERKENIDMQQIINLQDTFLNLARKDRQPVTLFLMNGFQMRGVVVGFDHYVVVVEGDGKQQIVYKHAISTIVPDQPVRLEW